MMDNVLSARQRKVSLWLQYASDDLRVAEHALKLSSSCPYWLIAYHAQQSVEKCIKAYLVFKDQDFPYTHDIKTLLDLCDDAFSAPIQIAKYVSPYAVTTRYPGQNEPVTKSEALEAIDIAKKVQAHVTVILETKS
jgi:HEPN domain-containing protein